MPLFCSRLYRHAQVLVDRGTLCILLRIVVSFRAPLGGVVKEYSFLVKLTPDGLKKSAGNGWQAAGLIDLVHSGSVFLPHFGKKRL
jgi:hypothetical protein